MRCAGTIAFVPAALLVACGSDRSSSLYGSGTATGGSAGSAATGGSASAGGSGGAPSTGTGGAATGSGGTVVYATGGTENAGGRAADAAVSMGGAPTGGSGGSLADGAPPPGDATVAAFGTPTPGSVLCAGTDCVTAVFPPYTCCVGTPPFPTGCFPTFPGCVNAVVTTISCDDVTDCRSGQTCCGTFSGQFLGTSCSSFCSSPSFQVCRTNAECPSHACTMVPEAPGYGRCGP